jgi:hypothetical protein
LDFGLALAKHPNSATRAQAERAWRDASTLLPLVAAATPKRRVLESKLHLLSGLLRNTSVPETACATCSQIPA